jgi:transcription termination/antitermination protein NusG
MSDDPANNATPTPTAPTDESKAETPHVQSHDPATSPVEHETVAAGSDALESVPPEAEATVEQETAPEANEPDPTSAPPPELAEPEVVAQAAEESAPDELVTAESPAAESEEPESAAKPKRSSRKKAAADATTASAPTATVTPTEEPAEGTENKKKWYAIKVQSGREESIKAAILRKVAIEGLEEFLGRIEIPVEEVIEKKQVKVKDKKTGESTYQEKKVTKKKKKFHGYIFAELEFNDRILYLFRETSGVGDFLNMRTGKGKLPVPEPMSDNEVKAMLTGEIVKDRGKGGKAKVKVEFEKGDRVKIREGPFANSEGEVKSITEPKDPTESPKVTVVVTLWGRPVDVELEYWQVEKA